MSDQPAEPVDAFVFRAPEPGGGDGVADAIWLDPGAPTHWHGEARLSDRDAEPMADIDPLPVLMVIADQQDFYFNE